MSATEAALCRGCACYVLTMCELFLFLVSGVPNQEKGILVVLCPIISQVGATSQPSSETGAWEDFWPEVTEGICKGPGEMVRSHI